VAYVHFGGLGWMTPIFCGVSPVLITLIVHFYYRRAKLGMDDGLRWVIAAGWRLVTIWPEAEEAVLLVRPVFPASSGTARGFDRGLPRRRFSGGHQYRQLGFSCCRLF
jgi:hypothetical protein